MRKSKKKRNNFADLDLEDDAESKPAGIEEVRANPDDEWPEEDVKPKKGKKGKKAKKQEVDSEVEEAEIAKPAERADLDDEWPEEDVKPKKGKKGKKSKAHTPADSDDEEVVEAKPEDVAEVKAAPVKEEKPAPAEKEADEKDSDDEGPKVRLPSSVRSPTDSSSS
jgi:translation initiation factor 5B